MAVTRWNVQILHPGQLGTRHFEHARTRLVGGTRLRRGQGVQRRAPGTVHALQHAAHLRREAAMVDVQVCVGVQGGIHCRKPLT